MNLTLLKADARRNLPLFVIIVYVMLLYFVVIAYMFDPSDSSSLSSMMELLPQGLMSSFGFGEVATNLTDFIVSYYYGFLVFVFPMIYCIITANPPPAPVMRRSAVWCRRYRCRQGKR